MPTGLPVLVDIIGARLTTATWTSVQYDQGVDNWWGWSPQNTGYPNEYGTDNLLILDGESYSPASS